MKDRIYTILEQQQKLDGRLRLAMARRNADAGEIDRLRFRKLLLRSRLAHLLQRGAMRPA